MTTKDIFDNVNGWLKFAEAKNASILAFNSAIIFGIFKIFPDSNSNSILFYYLCFVIFLLLVALTMSLISFIPMLKYTYIEFGEPSDKDNLLFFGDIAKYADYNERYKRKVKEALTNTENGFDDFYISQTIINSKIAYIKYKQFEIAIWFTFAAILTPIGAYILWETQKLRA